MANTKQGKINVKPHNKQVYIDILKDMTRRKDGVFSFQIKLNNGEIFDYLVHEKVQYRRDASGRKRIVNSRIL